MKKLASLLSILVLTLVCYNAAYSQSKKDPLEKTEGPFLNFHLNANYFNTSVTNGIGGGFAGGRLGLAFKRVSVYTGINFATLGWGQFGDNFENDPASYVRYEIVGLQYHFVADNPDLIPYAEASLSIFGFIGPGTKDGGFLSIGAGAAPSAGGGVKYFVSETFALDLGLAFSYGWHEENVNSFSSQLSAGFTWYPF